MTDEQNTPDVPATPPTETGAPVIPAAAPAPAPSPAPTAPAPGSPAPGSPAPGSAPPGSPAPGSPAPGSPPPGSPPPGSPTPGSAPPGLEPAHGGPALATAPAPRGTPVRGGWWIGTGRRKASVARVRIRPGDGKFVVNKRPHEEFFNGERDRKDLMNVLEKTRTVGSVDVYVNVHGGGFTGQAGAIVLGLARALNRFDPSLEPILRDNHFLTRDPRKVERKKYGQPGARARFQFSKR